VCVFNKNAKFPKVIENTNVVQTVSFKGFDLEDDNWKRWIQDYFLSFQLDFMGTGSQALSIPPSPERLWEKFRDTMERREPSDKLRAEYFGLILGDRNTNEFQLHFCEDTNHLM